MKRAIIAAAALALTFTTTPALATQHVSESPAARDMKGIERSLYLGKWYAPEHDDYRRCIMRRESRGNYRAANSRSSARGAYQFLDSQWRDGLVWMMLKEDKQTNGGLRKDIKALRKKPIHKWNRYYQDRAFWTAFRFGKGAKHWYYSGSPCNRLV